MAKHFGIEWAPLQTPVRRRRQTFIVWLVLITMFFGHILSIGACLFLLYFNIFTRLFVLFYLGWAFIIDRQTPHKNGRFFPSARCFSFWKHYCEFFPINLMKTHDLDPSKNYIFACHPHGVISFGVTGNFALNATGFPQLFPGIKRHVMTLAIQFMFPFFREWLMAAGFAPVSKECIDHILTKMGPGHSCVIVIGGAAEALEARPGNFKLVLKNRKGFIKMALKTGASLVPVYSFGEDELYNQVPNPEGSSLRKIQTKVKEIATFSPPLFHGRGIFQYSFGLLPFRKAINTVVGKPIHIEAISEPSVDDINKYHELYMESLQELFETYKTKFGVSEDKHLEFI